MIGIKGIALNVTLAVDFLCGCSGSSTGDSPGGRAEGGSTAAGGAGTSGGSASTSGTTNGPPGSAASGAGSGILLITIQCQSAGDCAEGQICCSETRKVGTVCQANPCETTLLGFPLQFCASDSECVPTGQSCVTTTVAGNAIRICRPGPTTPGTGGAPSAGGTTSLGGASGSHDASGFKRRLPAPKTADNEDYVDRQPQGCAGSWRLDDLSAAELADGMEPFVEYPLTDGFEAAGNAITNEKIFKAVNATMVEGNVNWCDRCVVLALHKDGPATNAKTVFKRCVEDIFLKNTLAEDPPEPNLRIDASTCSACPAGSVSDDNGSCQACLVGEVVENECNACQADAVLDGATMSFNTTFNVANQPSGDNCPDTFWVELRIRARSGRGGWTPSALTSNQSRRAPRRAPSLGRSSRASPTRRPTTTPRRRLRARSASRLARRGAGFASRNARNLPSQSPTQAEAAASVVRFGTPVMPDVFLYLTGNSVSNPPD